MARQAPADDASLLPADRFAPGWKKSGPQRVFTRADLGANACHPLRPALQVGDAEGVLERHPQCQVARRGTAQRVVGGRVVDRAGATAIAAAHTEVLMCSLGGSAFINIRMPGQYLFHAFGISFPDFFIKKFIRGFTRVRIKLGEMIGIEIKLNLTAFGNFHRIFNGSGEMP